VNAVLRVFVFVLLAIDGVISALLGAMFLTQFYVGVLPIPVSAVISGLVNALLVWAGLAWTSSTRLGGIALWTWLATFAALGLFPPSCGDAIFGQSIADQISQLVMLVLGVVPPGIVLRRHRV
jgi:hypothetical protein